MKKIHCLILFIAVWGFSCSNTKDSNEVLLAKTETQKLLKSDVLAKMPAGLSGDDSVDFIKNYVDTWLHYSLLFEKANDNINDSDSSIAKQVDLFRKDLVINKYEQVFLQQKLDTLIPQQEIDEYYAKHKNEFQIEETVVKPIIIVFPLDKKTEIAKIEKLFFAKNQDLDDLKDFCYQHCQKFSFADNWVDMATFRQELPLSQQKTKFTVGKGVKFKDSENMYFVKITEQVTNGTPMPLELAHDKIAKIILQSRKVELLKNMRNKVFQDATHKKQFEVYY